MCLRVVRMWWHRTHPSAPDPIHRHINSPGTLPRDHQRCIHRRIRPPPPSCPPLTCDRCLGAHIHLGNRRTRRPVKFRVYRLCFSASVIFSPKGAVQQCRRPAPRSAPSTKVALPQALQQLQPYARSPGLSGCIRATAVRGSDNLDPLTGARISIAV